MFGEIIGAWISQVWQDIGAPSDFALVEMGPGRGTLMRDILRICCKNMDFKNAADVRLIETSPVLSKQQQATLSGYDVKWQNEFHDDFDKPIIFIANELLDALPIHQFVKKSAGWQERYIGLSRDSNLEVRLAAPSFDPRLAFQGRDYEPDTIVELCPAALQLVRKVAGQINRGGGAGLFIDYGSAKSGIGDTVQAMSGHAYADILADPGNADITAHVDFERLRNISLKAGLETPDIVGQGAFLKRLGIELRAEMLKAQNPEKSEDIQSALRRLIHNDEMGQLFKVLGMGQQQLQLAGFGNVYI